MCAAVRMASWPVELPWSRGRSDEVQLPEKDFTTNDLQPH